jgi:hypothetical protein
MRPVLVLEISHIYGTWNRQFIRIHSEAQSETQRVLPSMEFPGTKRYNKGLFFNLTNPDDVLPAISGLAHRMTETTGDEYLAGLWKNHLQYGLLWFVEKFPC